MPRDYNFWIYIVTNRNQSVPYIGVTNSLSRRTWEHREGTSTGFASDYRCKKLIYYEHYRDIRDALARESQPEEMVPGKESRTNQSVESKLARFGHGRSAGQITVRDFSTSLEMTRSWLFYPCKSA
jgi:putative endonuclease